MNIRTSLDRPRTLEEIKIAINNEITSMTQEEYEELEIAMESEISQTKKALEECSCS